MLCAAADVEALEAIGTLNMQTGTPTHPDPQARVIINAADRQANEFAKAQRHTDRVRILKIALPTLAVLIILGFVAALVIRSVISPLIDLGGISINDGKLVMENPELSGFDGKDRPYSLSASRAAQDVENPARVELETISAILPIDETVSASVSAGRGLYDAEAKTLILDREVRLLTTDGMEMFLQDADVDIETGKLQTGNPVWAKSPGAEISSGSLLVEDNGKRIVFEEKVKMTLVPGILRKRNDEQN